MAQDKPKRPISTSANLISILKKFANFLPDLVTPPWLREIDLMLLISSLIRIKIDLYTSVFELAQHNKIHIVFLKSF